MANRKTPKRPPGPKDLGEAAELMREVLVAFPADEDRPVDAALRRRVEGAVIAAELAAGEQTPRSATDDGCSHRASAVRSGLAVRRGHALLVPESGGRMPGETRHSALGPPDTPRSLETRDGRRTWRAVTSHAPQLQ